MCPPTWRRTHLGKTSDWKGAEATVPAFTTFKGLVGYTAGPWSFSLNVNNLADKDTVMCSDVHAG